MDSINNAENNCTGEGELLKDLICRVISWFILLSTRKKETY